MTLDARQREKEVMRSHAYVGSALPVSDKVTLMASSSARGEFGFGGSVSIVWDAEFYSTLSVWNIDFGSSVSILAHRLGCRILFDVICVEY